MGKAKKKKTPRNSKRMAIFCARTDSHCFNCRPVHIHFNLIKILLWLTLLCVSYYSWNGIKFSDPFTSLHLKKSIVCVCVCNSYFGVGIVAYQSQWINQSIPILVFFSFCSFSKKKNQKKYPTSYDGLCSSLFRSTRKQSFFHSRLSISISNSLSAYVLVIYGLYLQSAFLIKDLNIWSYLYTIRIQICALADGVPKRRAK